MVLAPLAIHEWYIPFLDVSTSVWNLNPWYHWLASGGSNLAFPYGYAMWFTFLPSIMIGKIIGVPLTYAYSLTILIADIGLMIAIRRLLPDKEKLILITYWLSPIIIIASYVLGLNDLIPALFLTLAILSVKNLSFNLAGFLFAIAISSKISMCVALPFFYIYLFNNKALRKYVLEFSYSFIIASSILILPALVSASGSSMILTNPELSKIYNLKIVLTENIAIYIVPLLYLVFTYFSWRLRRLNFDLFQTLIGIGFLLVILLSPASPGWFVWAIPFLIINQAKSDRISLILNSIFLLCYTINVILFNPIYFLSGQKYNLEHTLIPKAYIGSYPESIIHTAIIAIGFILIIRILRETLRFNAFFRIGHKPFVLGIAGDSGSGKDTLVSAITDLIGTHSVVTLSGDNYHLWDRKKPIWQMVTHLNPTANSLETFTKDLYSLISRQKIQTRNYNHNNGKMSKPITVKSNDFILASGLHTLFFQSLRETYDLTIYLDINDELRKYFKLKRDKVKRNQTTEEVMTKITEREPDAIRFIKPQQKFANLIFSLQPNNPKLSMSNIKDENLKLSLETTANAEFPHARVNRALMSVCGLSLNVDHDPNKETVKMKFEGEFKGEDGVLVAELVCPEILQFLDIIPKWQNGMLGLMQLIVLIYMNEIFRKKLSAQNTQ